VHLQLMQWVMFLSWLLVVELVLLLVAALVVHVLLMR
jgi:hypothetical protein